MTFKVIKENSDNRTWKTGILTGLSYSRKITPFALVLSTQLTRDRYASIFKAIFDIMGRTSKVIVSDEEAAVASAILYLKDLN